jgi:hypothetical protein
LTSRRSIQLAKRIEMWQSWLTHLGLAHWRIEGVGVDEESPGMHSANASVQPSNDYASCWFWFRGSFVDEAYDSGDMSRLDITIIHEWLHVSFRDYYSAISLAEDQLGKPLLEAWQDGMDHANEFLVEALARQLYDAYKAELVS